MIINQNDNHIDAVYRQHLDTDVVPKCTTVSASNLAASVCELRGRIRSEGEYGGVSYGRRLKNSQVGPETGQLRRRPAIQSIAAMAIRLV